MAKIDVSTLERPSEGAPKTFTATAGEKTLTLRVRPMLAVENIAMFSYGDSLATELASNPVLVSSEVVHAPAGVCQIASCLAMTQIGDEADCYTEREIIALMVYKEFLAVLQEAYAFTMGWDSKKFKAKDGDDQDPLAGKNSKNSPTKHGSG